MEEMVPFTDEMLNNLFSLGKQIGVSLIILSILFFLVEKIIMGELCRGLAKKKGYTGYFFTGFFLGILGLLYVSFLPDLVMRKYVRMCSMKMQILDEEVNQMKDHLGY